MATMKETRNGVDPYRIFVLSVTIILGTGVAAGSGASSQYELSAEAYDRLAISNPDKLSAASKRAIERYYDQGPEAAGLVRAFDTDKGPLEALKWGLCHQYDPSWQWQYIRRFQSSRTICLKPPGSIYTSPTPKVAPCRQITVRCFTATKNRLAELAWIWPNGLDR